MGNSDKECFAKSGPKHLSEVDWGKEEHRRCAIACLVKGTSILESDRAEGRQGTPDARAPPWWSSFHLRLRKTLLCDCSCRCVLRQRLGANQPFIYGAIFEHVPPESPSSTAPSPAASPPPPRFIVAFRGTKRSLPAAIHDFRDDLSVILSKQDTCERFRRAREEVAELLESNGGSGGGGVWLAGHSLGASVALHVGRHMMVHGELNLPTFLFNPPRVSLAAAWLPEYWCLVKSMAKGAAARTLMRPHDKRMEALFRRLGPWVPELFVHKDDVICRGYIDYFEGREKMKAECPVILQPLAQSGMKHSFWDMVRNTGGQSADDDNEEQRVQQHLLPSARLWKNSTETGGLCHAHKLKHWWKPDEELDLSHKRYKYEA
ncbi:hypothetical protein GQ55_2G382500 [Panicum hallii var. hallii]|uniref:Fungal lipase-like domain-containing protein n=1 Tax=Panicum hallii var. hallii TaxID=1504633 RepID=A0A2T7EWT8_9POAL|nr:hypothetical protein GQ55_2G382500 [Panicum hallii var. hallii]